ncbi:alpha-galactosidase [Circinella umbellata]|nr:alpha-galactosidase [Circinella umbellata]
MALLASRAILLTVAIVSTFIQSSWAKPLGTGIHKHHSLDTWFLVTEQSSYVISAAGNGYLVNMHWGKRLTQLDDLNATVVEPPVFSQIIPVTEAREELPVFGGLRYRENILKAELPKGIRELNLQFAGNANITDNTKLDLDLRDGNRTEFLVTLHYEIDIENDIIRRSYTVRNGLDDRVNLSKTSSAAWHLPYALGWDEQRELVTLSGEWSQEAMVQTTRLSPGVKHTVESTRGFADHVSHPYFALAQVPNAVNPTTDVYFGALAWTGSWEIVIHTDTKGFVRVTGGIHHQDFGWTLEPGESFTTPVFAAGYTDQGLPGARRRMPRHARKYQKKNVATQKDDKVFHPVLYNSWEAVSFDLNEEKQMALAEKAAPLGIELFVVDDGWFGVDSPRDNDTAGLGDWDTNPKKFPNGLKPLADHVHKLGMKFGLWFEGEMVNPDSDLYREHPEWVFYYDGVPQYLSRTQLVLNFGLEEVRDYIFEKVAGHIEEAGIDYIKWDFNRPMQGVTMHNYDRNPQEAWVLAVEGYYEIIARLKERFPHLWFESCSSGGGRMDLGALERTDQVWTSDNTRPDARLFIQYGASLWVPPRMQYGWVTDSSSDKSIEIPLSFRFHVSFMGSLGLGSNINNFSKEQLEESTHWIALYKKLRHVIQNGDLDWLVPPSRVGELVTVTETIYNDGDEAVILAFRHNSPFPDSGELSPIRIRHLDENAVYRVTMWQEDPQNPVDVYELSGALLMYRGLELPSLNKGMFKSAVVWLQRA